MSDYQPGCNGELPVASIPDDGVMHTPGPWHWDSDPVKGDPYSRVRYRVCALGKTITQVYYSSFEGGATNAEADARLIAAAPDLLQSVRELAGWIVEGKLVVPRIYMEHAHIALAKVEGRS